MVTDSARRARGDLGKCIKQVLYTRGSTPRRSILEDEMKVKILIDDPGKRFAKGEIGIILENDYDKYDYFIELPGKVESPFGLIKRQYYFYKNEIEILGG